MLLPKSFLYYTSVLCLVFQTAVATWPVRNGTEIAKSSNYIVQIDPSFDLAEFGPKFVDSALHHLRNILHGEGHHLKARCFSEHEKKQVQLRETLSLGDGFKALTVKITNTQLVERLATSIEGVVSVFPDDEIEFSLPSPSEPESPFDERDYPYLERRNQKLQRRMSSQKSKSLASKSKSLASKSRSKSLASKSKSLASKSKSMSLASKSKSLASKSKSMSLASKSKSMSLASKSKSLASKSKSIASSKSLASKSKSIASSKSAASAKATHTTSHTTRLTSPVPTTTKAPTRTTPGTSTHVSTAKAGPTVMPFDVDYIEEEDAPWNLVRLSQRKRDLDEPYIYDARGGHGVTVYVVDDGINISHKDFGGRAKRGWSIYDSNNLKKRGTSAGTTNQLDGGGHGTHVAGIIGGTHYGVAKNVTLVSVQVLDASGRGTVSGVIGGLQYILAKEKGKGRKVVINMSLGLSKDSSSAKALDNAVAAVIKAGIPIIAAAGNSASDACEFIPAGNAGVYAVGAINNKDELDYYSCYGRCVNILAPGSDIESDYIGKDNSVATMSGTSMASPHVTGVAALLLVDLNKPTPQQLYDAITLKATQNRARNLPEKTHNLIAFNGQEFVDL